MLLKNSSRLKRSSSVRQSSNELMQCRNLEHINNSRGQYFEPHTMSAAYAMEPGVTAFILFNIACGRFILGLLPAVSSCLADEGAVNICL
jgi:hypothetical protein